MNIPDDYLTMSDAELYLELAGALSGGHAAPLDPEEAERTGFNYFQSVLPQIRVAVCGSPLVKSFVKKDDVFAVASAIAELISAHFALPRAAATISVLAARMGLKNLCPMVEP
jgi:hypothetical protein